MEKEDLELLKKALCAYLPFGLKYKDIPEGYDKERILNLNCFDWCLNNGKIILHPLSDLKKEEYKHIYNELTPWDIEQLENSRILGDISVHVLPYYKVQMLLKEHFDVFDLIPKGLAEDINTLQIKNN